MNKFYIYWLIILVLLYICSKIEYKIRGKSFDKNYFNDYMSYSKLIFDLSSILTILVIVLYLFIQFTKWFFNF